MVLYISNYSTYNVFRDKPLTASAVRGLIKNIVSGIIGDIQDHIVDYSYIIPLTMFLMKARTALAVSALSRKHCKWNNWRYTKP